TLHAAVLASPDDDAPRLAYADWLAKHGQPERAELIRAQCRLARLSEGDTEAPGLDMLARRLEGAHPRGWLAGRPEPDGVRWKSLRGSPEHVVFKSFTPLQQHHQAVFRSPVRRVGFDKMRSAARLAAFPPLPGVRELDLTRCHLYADGVAALGA